MEQNAHSKELQEVLEAARTTTGRTRGRRHSPLYEWLWARHEDLAIELNPPRTPNWTALAKQFGALGVYDGTGKKPTRVTVRQTWVKVDRDRRAVGTVPVRKPRGRSRHLEEPATTPDPAPEPAVPDVDNPYGFKTIKPK